MHARTALVLAATAGFAAAQQLQILAPGGSNLWWGAYFVLLDSDRDAHPMSFSLLFFFIRITSCQLGEQHRVELPGVPVQQLHRLVRVSSSSFSFSINPVNASLANAIKSDLSQADKLGPKGPRLRRGHCCHPGELRLLEDAHDPAGQLYARNRLQGPVREHA